MDYSHWVHTFQSCNLHRSWLSMLCGDCVLQVYTLKHNHIWLFDSQILYCIWLANVPFSMHVEAMIDMITVLAKTDTKGSFRLFWHLPSHLENNFRLWSSLRNYWIVVHSLAVYNFANWNIEILNKCDSHSNLSRISPCEWPACRLSSQRKFPHSGIRDVIDSLPAGLEQCSWILHRCSTFARVENLELVSLQMWCCLSCLVMTRAVDNAWSETQARCDHRQLITVRN